MKKIAFIEGDKVLNVVYLEKEKTIDPDGKAARGTAKMRHLHFGLHRLPDGTEAKRLVDVTHEEYEAVYQPWMNGEQFRNCLMIEDPKEEAETGGTWTKDGGFVARVWTPEEVAAQRENVVQQSHNRLAMSAWTQAPDEPEDFRKRWADYRQAIRDIMNAAGKLPDPFKVEWPGEPAITVVGG